MHAPKEKGARAARTGPTTRAAESPRRALAARASVASLVAVTVSVFAVAFAVPWARVAHAQAAADPAVGLWQVMDDETGKPNGAVRLFVDKDRLVGQLERLPPGPIPVDKCVNCPPPQRNKPLLGLILVWGLERQRPGEWDDGRIMDPKTGKVYRCRLKVDGSRLEVRGFMGLSLLGRTQTWTRIQ